MILKSSSPKQTREIAKKLAQEFKDKGGVVALIGELGAGKTTFAQGLAEGLGIEDKIISPTFVLIREHKIPDSKKVFFHIDLYRLEEPIDLFELGIKELFSAEDVVLIEWADKLGDQLPMSATRIVFEKIDQDRRKITFG